MPSACGVSWSGTSSGKLNRSSIPDPPDHKSHFLNAGDTKGDSSFPVVDGSGNLRAGNVNSAWKLRNDGEGVSESCLKKLDSAFGSRVLPDSAYENTTVTLADEVGPDAEFGLNIEFSTHPGLTLEPDGFNEHGVRVNDDGSIDVRFNAMEPGVRRGVEVTPEFLQRVADNATERLPVQLDHSKSQRANAGFIEPQNAQFGDGFLQLQVHVPDTGSSVRDDILADFKHDPPLIQDGSVGFDPRTVELDASYSDKPKFVDAELREFSFTPFPAGYDNGGLTAEFCEAVDNVLSCGTDTESALETTEHTLIKK